MLSLSIAVTQEKKDFIVFVHAKQDFVEAPSTPLPFITHMEQNVRSQMFSKSQIWRTRSVCFQRKEGKVKKFVLLTRFGEQGVCVCFYVRFAMISSSSSSF